MEKITNSYINKRMGKSLQRFRLKQGLTQEQLADKIGKSAKTISQIETGKDGTSKRTDLEYINMLGIMPNALYREFITNSDLKKRMDVCEKIDNLPKEKRDALYKIVDAVEKI